MSRFSFLKEQVRMKKEREMKLKEEKLQEAKQRLRELKEQQYKLTGLNYENNKKNCTYDYEGNIILSRPLKSKSYPLPITPWRNSNKKNENPIVLNNLLYF